MVALTRVRLIWRHLINSRMGDMSSKTQMPTPETALPDRKDAIKVSAKHDVNGNRTVPPFPEGMQMVMFGMGCFWGAERRFWRQKGVYSTQVGYSGGYTANATYHDVCTGKTGHTEVVRVVFHPENITFGNLLKVFWESHDPTQGMRQGNDVGTTYRSAIYTYTPEQLQEAQASKDQYQKGGPGQMVWNRFLAAPLPLGPKHHNGQRHGRARERSGATFLSAPLRGNAATTRTGASQTEERRHARKAKKGNI
ncbi:mitochondrial peptide methionine sulfoxide reductase isoform X1 [Alosa sapidissima]|uniref:mitochondrial peptide methionine sulfoxide reductase isoform X1 n=1 Tax=Alosa sapidissima TaxID=34773 RepID=UPI001C07F471|nr:mitochondrial peptide methionine sulfoxide reductase isoform X1 [Alosa sapidissima]